MMTPTDHYNLGMHHVPYTQSSYFQPQSQTRPVNTQNMQMPPQFHPFQSNIPTPNQPMGAASHSHAFPEMLPQDPLGRMQGLDIGSRSTLLVKSEGPSISASESSSIWCKVCWFTLCSIVFVGLSIDWHYWQTKVVFFSLRFFTWVVFFRFLVDQLFKMRSFLCWNEICISRGLMRLE